MPGLEHASTNSLMTTSYDPIVPYRPLISNQSGTGRERSRIVTVGRVYNVQAAYYHQPQHHQPTQLQRRGEYEGIAVVSDFAAKDPKRVAIYCCRTCPASRTLRGRSHEGEKHI